MQSRLDGVLENGERDDQDREQDGLHGDGNDQWPLLVVAPKAERFADQDNLGNHQGLDQFESISQVAHAQFSVRQAPIERERSQQHGEVQRDYEEQPQFTLGPLLESAL